MVKGNASLDSVFNLVMIIQPVEGGDCIPIHTKGWKIKWNMSSGLSIGGHEDAFVPVVIAPHENAPPELFAPGHAVDPRDRVLKVIVRLG